MEPFSIVLSRLIVYMAFNTIKRYVFRERKEDRDRHKGRSEVSALVRH